MDGWKYQMFQVKTPGVKSPQNADSITRRPLRTFSRPFVLTSHVPSLSLSFAASLSSSNRVSWWHSAAHFTLHFALHQAKFPFGAYVTQRKDRASAAHQWEWGPFFLSDFTRPLQYWPITLPLPIMCKQHLLWACSLAQKPWRIHQTL